MSKFSIKLITRTTIAPKLIKFVFEKDGDSQFVFEAGQFIMIEVGDGVKRAYSIASSPINSKLELFVDTNPGGVGSKFFERVKEGERVLASGPFGHFVYKSKGDAMFIATGTGVAPFRSIITNQLSRANPHNISLLFGVRHEEDIFLDDEFEALGRRQKNFSYTLTLSRPAKTWEGASGRVTKHLEEIELPEGTDYYICGAKQMVLDSKEILLKRGVEKERIFFELY